MRCLACGAEMTLMEVLEDKTMDGVRGFEHQTFICPKCHEIDGRFAFNKQAAPPIAPNITEPDRDES